LPKVSSFWGLRLPDPYQGLCSWTRLAAVHFLNSPLVSKYAARSQVEKEEINGPDRQIVALLAGERNKNDCLAEKS